MTPPWLEMLDTIVPSSCGRIMQVSFGGVTSFGEVTRSKVTDVHGVTNYSDNVGMRSFTSIVGLQDHILFRV